MSDTHNIQSVVICGSGNVATHLAKVLKFHNIDIKQVYSPTTSHAQELANRVGAQAISRMRDIDTSADLYLISISDDQIQNLSDQLPVLKGIVVHTSGITELNALNKHKKRGVFYPLQTFSKRRAVDFLDIPFCIEAADKKTENQLKTLAGKFSHKVFSISTEKRKQLHLAAVLVNNFPTHLYRLAKDILNKNDLDFDMLRPLITETGVKVMKMEPKKAQTGPAHRGDKKTIEIHRELLQHQPDILALYELISKQITNYNYE